MILCALYRPPVKNITSTEWNQFFNSISKYKYRIIGGNFNAHHPQWGSNKTCPSGLSLIDSICNEDLIILNDGSATYTAKTENSIVQSLIDLTVTSSNLALNSYWKVLEDRMFSDHPISINMTLKTKKQPYSSTHKINTKNIN